MSRLLVLFLSAILILLPVSSIQAQQSESIGDLQAQIKQMEAINADPLIPTDVKSLNAEFLKSRRSQLHKLLEKNVDALRKYKAAVGSSLSEEEARVLESRLESFEKALQELDEGIATANNRPNIPIEESETRPLSARAMPAANLASPRSEVSTVRANPTTESSAPLNVAPQDACTADVSNLPPRLDKMAEATAILIVRQAVANAANNVPIETEIDDEFARHYDELVYWNVAEALFTDAQKVNLRKLKWQEFSAETARTDKQVGASSRAGGSTTLAEKPGFANLLGFAVEHGAIQKEVSDTSLTLSTSLYAIIAASQGDTSDVYRRNDFFNRIGVSANFSLENKDNVLTNARRRQLNEWGVKLRLNRDRTARGADFQKFWDAKILPRIEKRAIILAEGFDLAFNKVKDLRRIYNAVQPKFQGSTGFLLTVLKANATASQADREAAIKKEILCRLRAEVYDPVKSGTVSVDPAFREFLNKSVVDFAAAQLEAEEGKQEVLDELKRLNDKPIASFAYSNIRPTNGSSSYSSFKGLYLQKAFAPMKVLADAEISIYNKPNAALNQKRIRDFVFALSFEGSAGRSPFISTEMDQSPITFSFTGSYKRLLENDTVVGRKADLGSAQFKMEVPVFTGLALPLSLSYTNATEERNKSGFRFNFGLGLDTDKLAALLRAKRQ